MKVHYKGLIAERFEDAPFIGSLWIAPDCKHRCVGCCNQHLLDADTLYEEGEDIINKVKDNEFSEGIIFAGLDPLTYPDELLYMIKLSLEVDLKIIIYTFLPNKDALLEALPDISQYEGRGIYIKYGSYDESKRVYDYTSYGVLLATSNQYIELL